MNWRSNDVAYALMLAVADRKTYPKNIAHTAKLSAQRGNAAETNYLIIVIYGRKKNESTVDSML